MHSTATVAGWIERILGHEGGFSLDPEDPGNWTGGEPGKGFLRGTKFGIAANTYPRLNIRHLTLDEAADIYISDFLAPLHADRYEDGVAFQLLDFAINSGPRRAVIELQQAIGAKGDGVVGPKTLAALGRHSEAQIVMRLLAERVDFMTGLSTWNVHGKGWMRRIARNLRYGSEDL